MSDTARRQIVRDAWRLAKPYWTSEEKWSAWGLLLAVIALDLGKVYISVRINAWNNAFYNALQAFNSGELFRQLGSFCILVAFAIAMSVYALYLNQMLQIRWRRWLTRRYLGAWLADHAYYQLQLRDTTDNPDQRIGSTRFKSPTSCAAHRRRANRRRLHLPPTATGGGRTRGVDDAGAVLWSRSMVSGFQPDERRGGD
jgi:hypothetical protein